MSEANQKTKPKLHVELEKVAEFYSQSPRTKTFNAMILGKPGSGKTYMLRTARIPVLVHSFDPGGTISIRKWINSDENPEGKIFVDVRFEQDEPGKPQAYKLWEQEVHRLSKEGFFENIGTYVLDSSTTWFSALIEETMKRRNKLGEQPSQPDWGVIGKTATQELKYCLSLPCDFLLLGHIDTDKDQLTGRMESNIALTPMVRKLLPSVFDEIYVTLTKETSSGLEYKVLTRNTGFYVARSRLAADGLLDTYEKPDIKHILKKAGFDTADKAVAEGKEDKGTN